MKKYIISGYGRYKYVKKVSLKRAKELEEKGKKVYDSIQEAKREIE